MNQVLKIIFSVAVLVATAASNALPPPAPRESHIEVKITAIGNTRVRLDVTNTAVATWKFLKLGTILDSDPVNKLEVSVFSKQ
jgi:hypothetical protein